MTTHQLASSARLASVVRRVRPYAAVWTACLLLVAGPASADNLLVNGDFVLPAGTPCVAGQSAPANWNGGNGFALTRNSSLYSQLDALCTGTTPIAPFDGYYASMADVNGSSGYTYQTVSGAVVGQTYRLHGQWAGSMYNADGGTQMVVSMQVRDGSDANAGAFDEVADTFDVTPTTSHVFEPFTVSHVAGSTQLTVVWRISKNGGWADATVSHVDDLVLATSVCNAPLSFATIVNNAAGGATAAPGETASVTITGEGFVAGMTAQLIQGVTTTIDGTAIDVLDATSMTADFAIPGDAPLGAYVLKLDKSAVEPDCASLTTAEVFAIVEPCTPPTLATIDPATGEQGQALTSVMLTGTGFVDGSTTVALTKAGETPIAATNVVVAPDGLSLTCDIDLTGAATGLWTPAVAVATCPPPVTLVDAFEVTPASQQFAPADFDQDNDVDLSDFTQFLSCFNGPARPPAQAGCETTDFDHDNDVDLTDFQVFLTCFNGPARPPACAY